MKIVFKFLLVFILVSNLSCSKKVHIETQWQSSEIKIDGESSDWHIPLRFFDANSKLNYEISNNNEGIFFAFRLNEMDAIHQFNQNGISIELDTLSSKTLSCILKYPSRGGRPTPSQEGTKQPDFTKTSQPIEKPMQQNSISLKGFLGYKKEVMLAMEEVNDIKASHSIDMDKEQLFCEIFIPYKSINPNTDKLIQSNSLFNIVLSLGNEENNHPSPPLGGRPGGSGMPGGGQGGPPPGGGMQGGGTMPGGGMQEGGHGAPDMNRDTQSKASKIKLEVQLATQPTK
ncbi:hypothetical protein [Carboxylicivirga linearis]|uniref:Uncharacterized protein n=1 Tax=Carboxylicivirga linearis TaxID=1628157 RepID=A0ABS5JX84_9BACT|nr:hypothetical protein [Carboxylicivirga linearis]MBS2099525.1 hypothetical protein [Carboxylicivirga linearis]